MDPRFGDCCFFSQVPSFLKCLVKQPRGALMGKSLQHQITLNS